MAPDPAPGPLRLATGSLVVLVAPSGSGKSTWAARHLGADVVVSSDALRGVVGVDEHDQRASADAFAVLDRIVEARCRRGLTTVVDSTGLQADRRAAYRAIAAAAGVPCVAVVLDVPEALARERNRARARPVPSKVLTGQFRQFAAARQELATEDWAAVHVVDDLERPVRLVGPDVATAAARGEGEASDAIPEVHLHLGTFDLGGEGAAQRLAAIARTAEEVGFAGIWVMDHLRQVPQVGRAWDDLPEAWTTLAFLASVTQRVRLGSLVSPVTFRPLAVLAKAVATVDVLSGGRATCGLGVGWFRQEHVDLGLPWPDLDERYERLEDHLTGLPVLWGPGSPGFEGRRTSIREATCYPRPVQEHVPLLVGGNGPRRTLRLAAAHADLVNLQGDPDAIAAGIAALHGHLDEVGRDREAVAVTVRASAVTRSSATALDALARQQAPGGVAPEQWATRVGAATVEDQVARLRGLGALGVQQVMLSVREATVEGIAAFAPVLAAR